MTRWTWCRCKRRILTFSTKRLTWRVYWIKLASLSRYNCASSLQLDTNYTWASVCPRQFKQTKKGLNKYWLIWGKTVLSSRFKAQSTSMWARHGLKSQVRVVLLSDKKLWLLRCMIRGSASAKIRLKIVSDFSVRSRNRAISTRMESGLDFTSPRCWLRPWEASFHWSQATILWRTTASLRLRFPSTETSKRL